MSLVQNPYSGKRIWYLSCCKSYFLVFRKMYFNSDVLDFPSSKCFYNAIRNIKYLCVCCLFFIALPCDLHRLSTHSTAALYIPSRRRWTPFGCWWKCKQYSVFLKDLFPCISVTSLIACKIWIGYTKDVCVKNKYKWVTVISELLLEFWSLIEEIDFII